MIRGILYSLAACFVWGLIFIVPQFVKDFSSIEIALGGYLVYGLLSTCLYLKSKFRKQCHYPKSIWTKALFYSLVSTIIYYTCIVLALRHAAPALCAIILGISPITIAFYGNWKEKEYSFKQLILPSILIFFGLVIINISHFERNDTSFEHVLGLLFSFSALIAWSWYVVANAHFLKKNSHIASDDWSTLMGVSTLLWVVICGVIAAFFFQDQLEIEKYMTFDTPFYYFILGCSILGILCSWLGTYFWNKASSHLPVSVAGQLTIFETLFGLLFVYGYAQDVPHKMECAGILLLLGAVVYVIMLSNKVPNLTIDNYKQQQQFDSEFEMALES